MPRVEGGSEAMWSSRLPLTVEAYLTSPGLEDLAEAEGGLLPHEAQALAALAAAAQRAAPPVLTGTQLCAQLRSTRLLSTGCAGIDDGLLAGGLRSGQLVEICGESASGKTQLCLAVAALAAQRALRVVWADAANAFSGRRLQQVLGALAPQAGPTQALDPLKFVDVRRCYDVHALLALLDELALAQQAQQAQHDGPQCQHGQQADGAHAPQQQQPQQQQDAAAAAAGGGVPVQRRLREELPVGLLVVDSLSALITPVLGGGQGQHSQGHTLLAAAAAGLKAFADGPWGAAVLVTNHLVGGSGEQRHEKRPAMGESWRNQPHHRIQLSRPPPGSADGWGVATLRASTCTPAGTCVPFRLSEAGLVSDPAGPAAAAGPQPMQC